MNLAETLRIDNRDANPMVRLEINESGNYNALGDGVRLINSYNPFDDTLLTANESHIHTGILSMGAVSVTPLTTELSDATIDRIANRVYELIREEINIEPRR